MTQATKRPWQARGNYLQVGNTHEDILICKCFDNAIALDFDSEHPLAVMVQQALSKAESEA